LISVLPKKLIFSVNEDVILNYSAEITLSLIDKLKNYHLEILPKRHFILTKKS